MKVLVTSLIGRPNVGKSSLLNAILDYDLAIVSAKAQTTRNQITGVLNLDDYQIVFTDTPGIHKPQSKFGQTLNKASYSSIKGIDLLMFLQPANEEIGTGDLSIIERVKNTENKIAVVTKIDLVKDFSLIERKAKKLKEMGFKNVIAVSTQVLQSLNILLDELKSYSYDSKPLYEKDFLTDRSMRFIASEIIREIAINALFDEIPHAIAVHIEEYSERDTQEYIKAIIFVNKNSQKGIVIGNGGKMIKKIGMYARKKLEKNIGKNVFLDLKVKVSKNWTNDEVSIKKLGY